LGEAYKKEKQGDRGDTKKWKVSRLTRNALMKIIMSRMMMMMMMIHSL
jgi:hypothetical protein